MLEYIAPAHDWTCATLALVVEYTAAVAVDEYVAPEPAATDATLAPTRASTSRVRSTKGVVTLCTDMLEKVERILRQTVRKSPSVRSVEHERIFKERRRLQLSSPKGPLPGLLGEYLLYA